MLAITLGLVGMVVCFGLLALVTTWGELRFSSAGTISSYLYDKVESLPSFIQVTLGMLTLFVSIIGGAIFSTFILYRLSLLLL